MTNGQGIRGLALNAAMTKFAGRWWSDTLFFVHQALNMLVHRWMDLHPNRMRLSQVSLAAQASLYILGGVNHFWHSAFYLRIMPSHYAHPAFLVGASGAAEIIGGIGLLVPATRRFAAAGIILMLLVFLDVHQFMLTHHGRFPEVPLWLLWARIPLQFLLVAWAAIYLRRKPKQTKSV